MSNWRATGERGDGVQVPAKSGEKPCQEKGRACGFASATPVDRCAAVLARREGLEPPTLRFEACWWLLLKLVELRAACG